MKPSRTSLVLTAMALATLSVSSQPVHASTGFNWLRIGAGARAVALGNAVVSNVSDPSANYWNPGAMAFIPGTNLELTHNESFQAVRYEFAGLTHQKGRNTWGVALHGVWTDDLPGRDELGNETPDFSYADLALAANYALAWSDQIGVGLGFEYLREVISTAQATGVAVNFGIQARDVLPGTDLGFSVLHLGSSPKFVEEEFDLPMTVQGGITHRIPVQALDGSFHVSAEVRSERDADAQVVFGSEYRYQEFTAIQVGYRTQHDTQDFSFGLGVGSNRLRGQYAYVPFGENLGDQHRFSVQIGL
ncbi:MAG: PorV/PorQ family protein [Candidatus Eisenbacteria bacterium]|uniref:PorV/PorQ family protein n=1 Tax=Eiseniibacteriota bacterium TaxID=2212470 RepID=A0A956SBV3_UNCEI|nr:PorV/PorQ family protein [Candidatus Eisenbacteria bacterium]